MMANDDREKKKKKEKKKFLLFWHNTKVASLSLKSHG